MSNSASFIPQQNKTRTVGLGIATYTLYYHITKSQRWCALKLYFYFLTLQMRLEEAARSFARFRANKLLILRQHCGFRFHVT